MYSLFDREYLGKPCLEQHQREIRQEIATRRLAQQVQTTQLRSTFVRPRLSLRHLKVLVAALVSMGMEQAGRRRNGQATTLTGPRTAREQSAAPR